MSKVKYPLVISSDQDRSKLRAVDVVGRIPNKKIGTGKEKKTSGVGVKLS